MIKCRGKKNDNTLFTEAQLLKNRILNLYKILEKKAEDPKVNGNECAKCCEVASDIAIEILKMESEGIKVVREGLGLISKAAAKVVRSSSSASINDRDMMMEELEKSC